MSEPAKKYGRQPESYSPKAKPEIVKMAAQAQAEPPIPYALTAPHTLETERVIVRRFRRKDWRDLREIGVSNNASAFADFDHPWADDAKGAKKACKWCAGNDGCWAVEVKSISKVVCFVNFNGIAEAIEKDYGRAMDIGHCMNDAYLEQGYDYEALAVLYDHCFRQERLDAIVAGWMMGEKAKLAPLVKLGMELHSTGMGKAFRGDREAEGCLAVITRTAWEQANPTSYSPKAKPIILSMAQEANQMNIAAQATVKATPAAIKAKARNQVRIIELPACKMVWSGISKSESDWEEGGLLRCFSNWFSARDSLLAVRDLLWYDTEQGGFAWGWAVDAVPDDTDGFPVMDFAGGLYATIVSVDADGKDHDRQRAALLKWIRKSGCFALDVGASRYEAGHILVGTPQLKNAMGYHQMELYVPIRIKEANEK